MFDGESNCTVKKFSVCLFVLWGTTACEWDRRQICRKDSIVAKANA